LAPFNSIGLLCAFDFDQRRGSRHRDLVRDARHFQFEVERGGLADGQLHIFEQLCGESRRLHRDFISAGPQRQDLKLTIAVGRSGARRTLFEAFGRDFSVGHSRALRVGHRTFDRCG
jgi:hypothetical protein